MFELKFETMMEKIEEEEKRTFLEDVRKSQICEVIESLKEEEFEGLQKSIEVFFEEIEFLYKIVRNGIKEGYTSLQILNQLEEVYLNSQEVNYQYRRYYRNLVRYIKKSNINHSKKTRKNEIDFIEKMERPFWELKNEVHKSILNRKDLKLRIQENSNQEVEDAKRNVTLCEEIKEELRKIEKYPSERNTTNKQIEEQLLNRIYQLEDTPALKESSIKIINQFLEEEKKDSSKIKEIKGINSELSDHKFHICSLGSGCDTYLDKTIQLLDQLLTSDMSTNTKKKITQEKESLINIRNKKKFLRRFIYLTNYFSFKYTRGGIIATILERIKLVIIQEDRNIQKARMEKIQKLTDEILLEEMKNNQNTILELDFKEKVSPFDCFNKEHFIKQIIEKKDMLYLRKIFYDFYLPIFEAKEGAEGKINLLNFLNEQ